MEEGERGADPSTRNDNSMTIVNPLEKGGHGTSLFFGSGLLGSLGCGSLLSSLCLLGLLG